MHDHSGHSHGLQKPPGKARPGDRIRLAGVAVLALAYSGAEIAGGLWTGSLALLADAGHLLSDVGALTLSLLAIWIAGRPPSPNRTYGYARAEILAALANGLALIAIALFVAFEAVSRWGGTESIDGLGKPGQRQVVDRPAQTGGVGIFRQRRSQSGLELAADQ